jgi:hypothetical protein
MCFLHFVFSRTPIALTRVKRRLAPFIVIFYGIPFEYRLWATGSKDLTLASGKKCKPIIVCDADKALPFQAYFRLRRTCPTWFVNNEGLSAVHLAGLPLIASYVMK